jgi:hypothetical protein
MFHYIDLANPGTTEHSKSAWDSAGANEYCRYILCSGLLPVVTFVHHITTRQIDFFNLDKQLQKSLITQLDYAFLMRLT